MSAWRSITAGVLLLAGCVAGCSGDPHSGYSFESSFPKDVRTVVVPVFKNQTPTVGVEAEITEAIIKEIQATTGMKVTTGEHSDTSLAGVITGVDMRKLTVRSGTGLVQEVAVQVTVDFDWTDNRTGKVLVSRRRFTATDAFSPAVGVQERMEVGQHAAIQRLAKDIVAEMRSSW